MLSRSPTLTCKSVFKLFLFKSFQVHELIFCERKYDISHLKLRYLPPKYGEDLQSY